MQCVDWLRLAYQYAAIWSDDPDSQVGAAVVDIFGNRFLGANRLPQGVKRDSARLQRPLKYNYIEHAERDALARAKGHGRIMYAPWAACCDCAKAIINHGISAVIAHKQALDRTPERWLGSIAIARKMLQEAGVSYSLYDGPIGDCSVLFDGEIWCP